jgi:hypothetical protein
VPDSTFGVDQQVERRVHEIDDVSRGHDRVQGCHDAFAAGERRDRAGHEVGEVPWAEERRAPDDECVGKHIQDALFHFRLAAAIDAQRRDRITFNVGALELLVGSVEDQVG